ncbi:MAG: DegT/DnrJ/EryC1/StrS family aminotransferase [Deltaproteobacteria bacterium]|nr:DegT/DnrJ/EryC1/StrS family aminotransferase [Deltaproteobacteria bacterium]
MIPIIQPLFGPEEQAAVAAVLRSGWVVQGPRVEAFESDLAAIGGAEYAVAVSSGTAGLHLSLLAANVHPGDDVIVPSLSFIATANAAWMAGARPVFADVAPDLPNVTPDSVDRVWTPQTRAVIAVHQLGVPFDRQEMRRLCHDRGAVLIEDAACALGSLHKGEAIAADAEFAVFSFHPRKVITTGEGGAILTNNPEHAERLRRLRNHGMSIAADQRHAGGKREQYLEPAWNFRMTDIQAAIGGEQLRKLGEIVERRRLLATRYEELLATCYEVAPLQPRADDHWNVQTYCVCVAPGQGEPAARRDEVLRRLNEQGIGARRGILAAHLEPAWHDLLRDPLPYTEAWAAQSLALPLFHGMTDDDQQQVAGALVEALQQVP